MKKFILGSLVCLSTAPLAYAQKLDTNKVIQAREVQIIGNRLNTKSAGTFKNLDKSSIEKLNFGQDLPFLLDNTPGVVVTSDAGAGVGYTGIRIRGTDATRVNVTINGIPYNDSESQGTFWVNMPDFASSLESIQIQRGVGTSTNGAGAFGASLNIQTQLQSAQAYAEINNSLGSFGTYKNTVKAGTGLINDRWSFDARLSRISSDGFVDRGASLLKSYFLSGAYYGKKDQIRVNVFSGAEKTYQAWNGVPESRLKNDVQGMLDYIDRNGLDAEDANNLLNSGSRTYNSFLYPDQNDNYWQDHYQFLYSRSLLKDLQMQFALHYTRGKGYFEEFKKYQRLSNYGLEPVTIGGESVSRTDLVRRRWLDNHFYGATYAFQYAGFKNWQIILAGAYNEYDGDHYGQVIWSQFSSNGNNFRKYYDNKGFKTDFNTYLKASYTLNNWMFFGDIQFRKVDYSVRGIDKNLNPLNLADPLAFWNPKIGLSYQMNPQEHLYAAFSFTQKEPNRDDYINANLNVLPLAEKLQNLELGYRVQKEKFNMGLNAYGMWYKDQLVITGKINEVGEYYRQNVKDSYRMGVEWDAQWILNNKLSLLMNASISKNKIQNFTEYLDDYDAGGQQTTNYTDTDISFSPNQVLGAELVYAPLANLSFSWQSKYVGKQYLDNTQNERRKLDDFMLHHLRLGYQFKVNGFARIQLGLKVENLFAHQYESNGYTYAYIYDAKRVTENFYFPQAGRNVMFNLNLKF